MQTNFCESNWSQATDIIKILHTWNKEQHNGLYWIIIFLFFCPMCFFFNVGVCTALIRVLYCIVYALRTACTVVIFFVSVFLLSVNLFSQCMGVHCFVNHTCTSLIMVLCCTFVYFHTVLNYFTCFAFFYLCFCSYVFLFSNLCSCTALLGMLRLHSTNSVLHSCTTCTACVLFAFCTTISSPAS